MPKDSNKQMYMKEMCIKRSYYNNAPRVQLRINIYHLFLYIQSLQKSSLSKQSEYSFNSLGSKNKIRHIFEILTFVYLPVVYYIFS